MAIVIGKGLAGKQVASIAITRVYFSKYAEKVYFQDPI